MLLELGSVNRKGARAARQYKLSNQSELDGTASVHRLVPDFGHLRVTRIALSVCTLDQAWTLDDLEWAALEPLKWPSQIVQEICITHTLQLSPE